MLVLTRKVQEATVILLDGQRITVTVVDTRGDRVRLAFDAPREVRIVRQEVSSDEGGSALVKA